ncbi:hypothetical protein HY605_01305 [Candidatus Peregrinibacteria bacterium]|nr:hypothetical protein [Candidatus Peregrinibacteria bacterium]
MAVKVLLSLALVFLCGSLAFAAPDDPAPAAGAVAAGGSVPEADESEEVVETIKPGSGILPNTKLKIDACKILMNEVNKDPSGAKTAVAGREVFKGSTYLDILGCGIKTGDIRLWMIAYYVRFILEFIIGLSGLIAVGGIVYGGYLYLFAGISEDKDKGKKAIMYGVGGMVLTLLAWAIVNIVISFVTI